MTPTPAHVGDALPALTKTVTQGQVSAYADAARDWNPIHLDAAFAATTQFGTRIAHGMLGLGFMSTFGEITKIEKLDGRPVATCKIGCLKPDGTEAISGTATALLRNSPANDVSSTTAGRRGD
jgi:hypothetical protein